MTTKSSLPPSGSGQSTTSGYGDTSSETGACSHYTLHGALSELPEDGDLADLSTAVLGEPAAEEEAVEQCDHPYSAFLTGSFVPSSHVSCAFPTVNQE